MHRRGLLQRLRRARETGGPRHGGGVPRLVPTPPCDHRTGDATGQPRHRGAVAQDMRRAPLVVEGGGVRLSGGDGCGQPIRHASTAERPPARGGKPRRFRAPRLFPLPRAYRGARGVAPGDTAYSPTGAVTAYRRPRAQAVVTNPAPGRSRNATKGGPRRCAARLVNPMAWRRARYSSRAWRRVRRPHRLATAARARKAP